MSGRKLPRSSLSEVLRFKSRNENVNIGACASNGSQVQTDAWYNGSAGESESDAGSEIKRIFSQQKGACRRSSIFGCSPPVRATNPLISDSKFWRQTNKVERVIEGGHCDSGLREGLEKVICTLSPPNGPSICSCEST